MRVISGICRGTKLKTLDENCTRPTLDRVKESLFNILGGSKLLDAYVLDLFAGSGSLGIEALSRGAKLTVFNDNSKDAIGVITSNLTKIKGLDKSIIINKDFSKALEEVKAKQLKFDVIFVDAPYGLGYGIRAIEEIMTLELLKDAGCIVFETDSEIEIQRLKLLEKKVDISEESLRGDSKLVTEGRRKKKDAIEIYDLRKYGRVRLVFLNRKG